MVFDLTTIKHHVNILPWAHKCIDSRGTSLLERRNRKHGNFHHAWKVVDTYHWFCLTSSRKCSCENTDREKKIDKVHLLLLINSCKHMKYNFAGVYAEDFPLLLVENIFLVVNSNKANRERTYWVVLCDSHSDYFFADALGLPAHHYNISGQLSRSALGIKEVIDQPPQEQTSWNCGLYCFYVAHYVFNSDIPAVPFNHESELMRSMKHLLWRGIKFLIWK